MNGLADITANQANQTLLMVGIKNAGFTETTKALQLASKVMVLWAMDHDDATWRHFIEYWEMSKPTTFRYLDSFRAAFPGLDHPVELAEIYGKNRMTRLIDPEDLDATAVRLGLLTARSK